MSTNFVTLAWFVSLTVVCGGAAAFMSGRAIAAGWHPQTWLPLAAVPLAGAVWFLHYALAGESLDAAQVILSFALLFAFAFLGFALQRRAQMARQYPWLAT